MSDQILKPTLTIKVGPDDAPEEFVLRVPTPFERSRIGVRESSIKRMMDPMGGGDSVNVDTETWFMVRGMAVLETLLEKASVTWPYSEVKDRKGDVTLVVDITKFPPGKEPVITEVGLQFQQALDRFHGRGTELTEPAV